ncbi:MAG TPA: citrate/2-methylcitrate synthase, partial [Gemmatales bacterium]|nr:citrate/2-methylcitrate synthase [Gemmatales bacterium]
MSAAAPATEVYSPGLEGVIAGESAISTVADGLRYRGYPIGELASKTSFEEVAFLLLHGELPNASQRDAFLQRERAARRLPAPLSELLAKLPPGTNSTDIVRTGVSILAHFDPDVADNSHAANVRKAERLLAQIPLIVADSYRLAKGQKPVPPRSDLGLSANFLYILEGKEATPADVKAFDLSLILYAEHEFNASTFTSRVICSTLSDLHSSIVGAIGALKGPLHGGANEKVMDVLRGIGGPDRVEAWLRDAFARKEKIMGFGHRIYKVRDPRADVLKAVVATLGGRSERLRFAGKVEASAIAALRRL